jgi:UDP-N-acetylglucosamine:LPS N-acetylglucosamine transferase
MAPATDRPAARRLLLRTLGEERGDERDDTTVDEPRLPLVLILGGSLGAQPLNHAVRDALAGAPPSPGSS